MNVRREHVLAVASAWAFLIVLEAFHLALLYSPIPFLISSLLVILLGLVGVIVFTIFMFQLLDAARQRVVTQNRQLAALDEASLAIASEVTIDKVLQRITDIARDLSGARYAAVGILGPDGYLVDLITSGMTPDQRRQIGDLPKSHGLLGRMLREGYAVRFEDIALAPGRSGFPANHPRMRSLMGVPIRAGDRVVGDLYLADKAEGGEFTNEDERLIVLLAAHAAVAIENARLHQQVQQLAILEERDRIGRELHDGTIQSIYGVQLVLEDAQELATDDPASAGARIDQAIESLNAIIRELRSYILDLRPQVAPGVGLTEGLQQLAEQHRAHTLAEVELTVDGSPDLDATTSWQIVQFAREALSNAARHAAASRVTIAVTANDRGLSVEIGDNGRGFDPRMTRSGGQGLRNMMDRIAQIGGTLTINSVPGQGSQIHANVPIRREVGAHD